MRSAAAAAMGASVRASTRRPVRDVPGERLGDTVQRSRHGGDTA
ncbi:MAG: hypothetical protein ACREXU_18315 [Gammaproteobacteria bacterium]